MASKETTPEPATAEAIKAALAARMKTNETAMKDQRQGPRERREAQQNVQALRRVMKMF